MNKLPAALFIVDIKKTEIAVREASILKIPVVAIVDTNCDPGKINYVIPGNDDAMKSIRLISSLMADKILEGKQELLEKQKAAAVQAENNDKKEDTEKAQVKQEKKVSVKTDA